MQADRNRHHANSTLARCSRILRVSLISRCCLREALKFSGTVDQVMGTALPKSGVKNASVIEHRTAEIRKVVLSVLHACLYIDPAPATNVGYAGYDRSNAVGW